MKELLQKTIDESMGCHHNDRTESKSYVRAQTFMWIVGGKPLLDIYVGGYTTLVLVI